MNRILRTIGPYFGVISVFLYLLYVVGRTYISGYLYQLGIPPETLNFDIDDYAYYGLRLGSLILTISFTVIFIGFIRYIIFQPNLTEIRKLKKLKWPNKIVWWQVFIYTIYFAVVFVLAGFMVSGSYTPLDPPLIFMALMVCIFFVLWCFFFLFDSRVITWMKTRKKVSAVFVIALAVQLVFFPFISSRAWGAFDAGYIHTQFPKVQIEWVNSFNQTFGSNEDLYWVIGDNEHLILKSSSNSFYLINRKDILSIEFQPKGGGD